MHVLFQDKFEILLIFFGQCRERGHSIGKVHPFFTAQSMSVDYLQFYFIFFIGFQYFKYHLSIVAQYSFSGVYILREQIVVDRNLAFATHHVFGGKFNDLSRFDIDIIFLKTTNPDFRALKICQNTDIGPQLVIELVYEVDDPGQIVVFTMGKIESENIDSGQDKFFECIIIVNRWSDGSYYFGFLKCRIHNFEINFVRKFLSVIFKWHIKGQKYKNNTWN